ncbi:hypothetical protein ABZY42_27215 [Streptomyces sp. NPDC006622]|uniref:hypothetical protein n=1 Tax=Streptomyces sp. NPDC006622 TaxID=3155459 RepID=UPI0033BA61EA
MRICVEARIRADLDDLWTRTQEPAQQQRWDLRFSEIAHLPRAEGEPQRFRYATRVLPFLTVTGTGVPTGERRPPDGTRTSALRYTSAHRLSLPAEGSRHWRYVPDGDGVRFLACCDYQPRWGVFGALADRLVFRPLMGWATAWSLDRLRLWLERGITPERALRNWLAEVTVRVVAATVACAGLGWESFLRLLGPFAASTAYLLPLLLSLVVCLALLVPPLARTPAARRCLRTPPVRACASPLPRTLEDPR